jgi:hypothetical protein
MRINPVPDILRVHPNPSFNQFYMAIEGGSK